MCMPQFTESKTYMSYPHPSMIENQYAMPKTINQTLNTNFGFGFPSAS